MEKTNYIEIDLVQIGKSLWKKLWLICIIAFLGAAAGFCCARFLIEPKYESQAKIYVNNTDAARSAKNQYYTNSDLQAAQSLVETYLVIMKSRSTLGTVIQNQKLPYTYEQLCTMVSGKAENDTEIFSVTVTSSDPNEAVQIVNGIVDTLPQTIAKVVDGASVRTIDRGVLITEPVSPSKKLYTAVGGMIGLLLILTILIIHALTDRKIRDESFIDNLPERKPLLAAIPDLSRKNIRNAYYTTESNHEKIHEKKSGDGYMLFGSISFSAAEAYKLLRINTLYSLPDGEGCTVVGITSATRGEGKSTTSMNLAYAFAETGKRVLLIEGDMRLPNIAEHLNVNPDPGLSNAIGGFSEVDDVIQKTAFPNDLYVITSGNIPPNPAELLSSKRMSKIMTALKPDFDHIIIDLPPINLVTDALAVAPYVDGMIVVSRENYSDYSLVTEAVQKLIFAEIKLLGYVLTRSTAASKATHSRYYHKSSSGEKKSAYGKTKITENRPQEKTVENPDDDLQCVLYGQKNTATGTDEKSESLKASVKAGEEAQTVQNFEADDEMIENATNRIQPADTDDRDPFAYESKSIIETQSEETESSSAGETSTVWAEACEKRCRIVQSPAVAGKPMMFVKTNVPSVTKSVRVTPKPVPDYSVRQQVEADDVPICWDVQQSSSIPRQIKSSSDKGPMVMINVAMVND